MLRRVSHLIVKDSRFPNAGETLWSCDHVTLNNVELRGADYVFMNGEQIEIDDMKLQGNYSFQDAKHVVIRNSYLDSKDTFRGTENVTVYDSVLIGEYLGRHSKNLRLVNCTIRGEQPLCYARKSGDGKLCDGPNRSLLRILLADRRHPLRHPQRE